MVCLNKNADFIGAVRAGRGQRGSAMLIMFFVMLVLMALAYWAYEYSDNATRMARMWTNKEKADYTADYAANLILSQLASKGSVEQEGQTVTSDWVGDEEYRIARGELNGYDWRVMVRSENSIFTKGSTSVKTSAWMSGKANDATDTSSYGNGYEIFASARNQMHARRPEYAYTSSLHGIVDMSRTHVPRGDDYTVFSGGNESLAGVNMHVSGEDHAAVAIMPNMLVTTKPIVNKGVQRVKTGEKVNFEGGKGDAWWFGHAVVNYMLDESPVVAAKKSGDGYTFYDLTNPNDIQTVQAAVAQQRGRNADKPDTEIKYITKAMPNSLVPRTDFYSDDLYDATITTGSTGSLLTKINDVENQGLNGKGEQVAGKKYDRMMLTRYNAVTKNNTEADNFYNLLPAAFQNVEYERDANGKYLLKQIQYTDIIINGKKRPVTDSQQKLVIDMANGQPVYAPTDKTPDQINEIFDDIVSVWNGAITIDRVAPSTATTFWFKTKPHATPAEAPLPDNYLVGGKSYIANGYTFDRFADLNAGRVRGEANLKTTHSVTPDKNNPDTGLVLETSQDDATENFKSSDLVVNSWQDLANVYVTQLHDPGTQGWGRRINAYNENLDSIKNWAAQKWSFHFLNEYYDVKDKAVGTFDLSPFDSDKQPAKMRQLNKPYIRNAKGEVLCYEMCDVFGRILPNGDINNSTYSSSYASGTRRVYWTGRYYWGKIKFGATHWSDRNRHIFVDDDYRIPYTEFPNINKYGTGHNKNAMTRFPRIFSWEEIMGYEVVTDADGRPILDNWSRPVYKLDENGERIPRKGFDERVMVLNTFNEQTGGENGVPLDADIQPYPVHSVSRHFDAKGKIVWDNSWGNGDCCACPTPYSKNTAAYKRNAKVIDTPWLTVVEEYEEVPVEVVDENGNSLRNNLANQTTMTLKPKTIKYYKSMDDFLYDVENVTVMDEKGKEHVTNTKMGTIVIGFEDRIASNSEPDFDNSDMIYTLHVLPEVKVESGTTANGIIASTTDYQQWWEQEQSSGLTGGESQTAISNTAIPGFEGNDALKNNFDFVFGSGDSATVTANAFTSLENGMKHTYERVMFDSNGDLISPQNTPQNGTLYFYGALAKNVTPDMLTEVNTDDERANEGNRYNPEKYDDILDFVNKRLSSLKQAYVDWYTYADKDAEPPVTLSSQERKNRGMQDMRLAVEKAGYKLADISTREDGIITKMLGLALDEESDTDKKDTDNIYRTREAELTARRQAGLIFGYEDKSVSTIKTNENLQPDTNGDSVYAPIAQRLRFVAYEAAPSSSNFVKPDDVFLPQDTDFYKNSLNELTAENIVKAVKKKEKDTDPWQVGARFFLADAETNGNVSKAEADKVVEQIYTPLYGDMAFLYSKISPAEIRSQLGWRRQGSGLKKDGTPDLAVQDKVLVDLYVPVFIGAKRYQPYMTAMMNPAPNTPVIAMKRTTFGTVKDQSGQDKEIWNYMAAPKKGTQNGAPEFTFTKPIDGAGVLVIDGDLVVKTSFAYHGTMIVLGNLTIDPQLGDVYAKDENGNYLDEEGRVIYRRPDGSWYRIENTYNDDNEQTGYAEVAATPHMTQKMQGSLNVQGQLIVDGKVTTNSATGPGGEEFQGSINVQASKEATEIIDSLVDGEGNSLGRFSSYKIVWDMHSSAPTDNLWK